MLVAAVGRSHVHAWIIDVVSGILAYEPCTSLAVGKKGPSAIGGKVDALLTSPWGDQ
jgi:hypothetical protein